MGTLSMEHEDLLNDYAYDCAAGAKADPETGKLKSAEDMMTALGPLLTESVLDKAMDAARKAAEPEKVEG